MDPVYLCLINNEDEEIIHELPSEFIDEATQIPYFRSMYGTLDNEGNTIGSSKYPIAFRYTNLVEFMTILNMLKLKKDQKSIPFENKHITYHMLINHEWQYLWLPKEYLKTIQDMSTESIIKCMCTCSQLSLWELRQLFIYRIIYLLNKNFDTIGSTMESLVTYASYEDILIFQKQCAKLMNVDSNETVPVREGRSKSF